MRLKIKYIAIDPYYSDMVQIFVGSRSSIDQQVYDFESWLGKGHLTGIASIYKTEIIDSDEYIGI